MIPPRSARPPFSFVRAGLLPALAFVVLCLWNDPAAADFRLCNNTSSRVGIALGYKDMDGWTTEGWWNVPSRSCETLLKGALLARFYYIYALDYDRGGEWSGQAFMCSRDKEFTIRGTENCLARGFDRTGFFEVDTGEQRAWTVQLTDANEQQPGQQRVPGLPGTVGPNGTVPGLPNGNTAPPGAIPPNSAPPNSAPPNTPPPNTVPPNAASPSAAPPGASGPPPAATPGTKP
jgi:uncharacterized membrane protein